MDDVTFDDDGDHTHDDDAYDDGDDDGGMVLNSSSMSVEIDDGNFIG